MKPNATTSQNNAALMHSGWSVVVAVAIALPWLNPFTWGPNPELIQRLVTLCGVAVLLLCWAARGNRGSTDLARALALGWLLAALLSSAIALLQYFAVDTSAWGTWINTTPVGQAYGNLRQRNQFASLTSLGLIALLYLSAASADTLPRMKVRVDQVFMFLALALLALGNAASSSRTGALQWVLVLLLAWLWARRPGTHSMLPASLAAVVLYLLATWFLPELLQWTTGVRATSALERFQENVGCESRSVLWRNVAELVAQKPWLGWGWGELKFAHFMYPYSGERFCQLLDNAHNLPLHLAVTLGLPASVLICGALLIAVWRARPWRDTSPVRHLAWAALAIMGLHSLLEYPLWYGPFQVATLLCLGLLWDSGGGSAEAVRRPSPAGMGACAAVAGFALALSAYAGWDYWRVGQLYVAHSDRASAYRDATLDKVSNTWLFQREVQFAYVTTATPDADNAKTLYVASLQTLHFSPEPRVVATLLACADLLGDRSELVLRIRERQLAIQQTTP